MKHLCRLPMMKGPAQLRTGGILGLASMYSAHVGLRQLHTKQFCMQLTKAYVAETSCNQLLIDWFCYVIAHNLFACMLNNIHSLFKDTNSARILFSQLQYRVVFTLQSRHMWVCKHSSGSGLGNNKHDSFEESTFHSALSRRNSALSTWTLFAYQTDYLQGRRDVVHHNACIKKCCHFNPHRPAEVDGGPFTCPSGPSV